MEQVTGPVRVRRFVAGRYCSHAQVQNCFEIRTVNTLKNLVSPHGSKDQSLAVQADGDHDRTLRTEQAFSSSPTKLCRRVIRLWSVFSRATSFLCLTRACM